MTYEESIHKMLEQLLKNQADMMQWMDPRGHIRCLADTKALLKQVKK